MRIPRPARDLSPRDELARRIVRPAVNLLPRRGWQARQGH